MAEHVAVELQDERFAQEHGGEVLENSGKHLEIAGDLLLIARPKLADAQIAIKRLHFLVGETGTFDSGGSAGRGHDDRLGKPSKGFRWKPVRQTERRPGGVDLRDRRVDLFRPFRAEGQTPTQSVI